MRKQLELARASVDAMLASNESSPSERAEAMGILGRLYLGYDLSRAAEAALRNAQQLEPGDFRWVYYLGSLYQHERRVEEASAQLRRALELRPQDVPSLLRLGEVELARARVEEAARAFAAALALDAESAAAHEGLARAASPGATWSRQSRASRRRCACSRARPPCAIRSLSPTAIWDEPRPCARSSPWWGRARSVSPIRWPRRCSEA